MTRALAASLLDDVLPRRERLELIRRDALSDFAGATGSALHELMSAPVTVVTWRRYTDRHAIATKRYRAATVEERRASRAVQLTALEARNPWRQDTPSP